MTAILLIAAMFTACDAGVAETKAPVPQTASTGINAARDTQDAAEMRASAPAATGITVEQVEETEDAATTRASVPQIIVVTPSAATFSALEQTVLLVAEVRDQDGRVMMGERVSWSSADPAVATVDSGGQVTAVGNGSTTVTATAGAVSGYAAITVRRTAPLWTLRGTVDHGWAEPLASGHDVAMASDIEGAVVEIVDGPNAGRRAVTDERGRWTLQELGQARVTVRVTAEGFEPAERTVDLTADTELPFAVSRRLPHPGTPAEYTDTDPEYIQALAPHYPYAHRVGNVRVFSDISAEFSREHAEHAWNVWAFFDDLYAANRGDYLDAYYTTDLDTFLRLRPHCRADLWHQFSLTNDTRVVTACYLDYPRWFIIPYQTPDFGTQLHEFGHDFLFAVWPAWDDYKWFIEGTATYFEGGVFSNTLRVPEPIGYCSVLFDQWEQQDRLIPLGELLRLDGAAYLADNHRTYPLSCMLFHYLERHHPGVLYSLIEQINSRQITTNDRLIDIMLELTGKSLSELEEAYTNYARQTSS